MVTERVKNTIINNHLIKKGEHIVIGLSGGPDSVCLFHILHELREELGIRLYAVHINHGLRPGAADEDQRYVEDLCAQYEVPCHSFCFDVSRLARESGMSSEDAGRQVRYQSFFKVAEQIENETGGSAKIAVAQNMNDQAETVLMRILRGTGTEGLCGIEYLRTEKNRGIIRPLLDVTRAEIEAYCREHGLEPRIDLTNLEPIYTRNKIRLELLPYLSENYNGNIVSALNRLSRIAKEDKDYFSGIIETILDKHAIYKDSERAAFPRDILCGEHPAIRHRIVMRIFESIGLSRDIASVHLEQADRLIREGKTSASTDFTAGYALGISYDTVEFYKKRVKENPDFEYEINKEGITEIPELNAVLGVKILRRKDMTGFMAVERNDCNERDILCRLSFDKILESGRNPVLRTRRQGDYIVPLGMQGRKKLQDFFVDEKYSRAERDRIPILCLGNEVLWIVGGRISENYKVADRTERIISLEYSTKI